MLRDEDDADDAFSIFSEWTWRGMGGFRRDGPVQAWALGIARNAARKVRNRQRRVPRQVAAFAGLGHGCDSGHDELELAALRLAAVRSVLPAPDRELLGLRLDEGLPWNEIASRMAARGVPVSSTTLRKRFERLKARMGLLAREAGPSA